MLRGTKTRKNTKFKIIKPKLKRRPAIRLNVFFIRKQSGVTAGLEVFSFQSRPSVFAPHSPYSAILHIHNWSW